MTEATGKFSVHTSVLKSVNSRLFHMAKVYSSFDLITELYKTVTPSQEEK